MKPKNQEHMEDPKADRKALTIALPVGLLRRFRLACAADDQTMSAAAEDALTTWVADHYEQALKRVAAE